MAPRDLQLVGGPVPAGARDSETIPPEELLQYVADRLLQEATAAEQLAKERGLRGLPGDRERNIAITNLQTAQLWLRESRAQGAR